MSDKVLLRKSHPVRPDSLQLVATIEKLKQPQNLAFGVGAEIQRWRASRFGIATLTRGYLLSSGGTLRLWLFRSFWAIVSDSTDPFIGRSAPKNHLAKTKNSGTRPAIILSYKSLCEIEVLGDIHCEWGFVVPEDRNIPKSYFKSYDSTMDLGRRSTPTRIWSGMS